MARVKIFKIHEKTYNIWRSMIFRCYNPKCDCYHNYGGRGIKVCNRWLESYYNFYNDMGKKPGKGYSLDRIDNNGDYTPDAISRIKKISFPMYQKPHFPPHNSGKYPGSLDISGSARYNGGMSRSVGV